MNVLVGLVLVSARGREVDAEFGLERHVLPGGHANTGVHLDLCATRAHSPTPPRPSPSRSVRTWIGWWCLVRLRALLCAK